MNAPTDTPLPLNHEIRAILAREPGLTATEVFSRVTQKTARKVVAARLCNMVDNDYVRRDYRGRYELTGKTPARRVGSLPFKSRTRRDEDAAAVAEVEAAHLFRQFQITANPQRKGDTP